MGVVAFNPQAAKIKDVNGNPLVATVNYSATDWHIIHEDRTLGSSTDQSPTARLTLHNIYQLGQALSNNTIYPGLVPSMTTPVDVYAIDLNTGAPIPGGDYTTDYGAGVVTFNTTKDAQLAGAHVRIFYKAMGDWGLAVVKAPAVYVQKAFETGDQVPPDPPATGQASINGQAIPPVGNYEIMQANGANGTKLLFPGTDVGKVVHIGGVVGSNGQIYTDANTRVIQPGPSYRIVMNGNDVAVSQYGMVNLTYDPNDPTNSDGYLGVLPQGINITSVSSVIGASLSARVIWKVRTAWKSREITDISGGST